MSELFAAPADPQVVVEDPEHVIEGVSQPPVVITEQAVAFSTAAAVPLPRTKPTRRVIAALRAMFLSSSGMHGRHGVTIHRGAPPFSSRPKWHEQCTGCDRVPDPPRRHAAGAYRDR